MPSLTQNMDLSARVAELEADPADIEAGSLGEPRVITDFLGEPGKPDGMAYY